jgi:predicted DNA-binding protein
MQTKNEQIGFRLPANLKKELQDVAKREGRTPSQVCELFVPGGLEGYRKDLDTCSDYFRTIRKNLRSRAAPIGRVNRRIHSKSPFDRRLKSTVIRRQRRQLQPSVRKLLYLPGQARIHKKKEPEAQKESHF